MRESVSYWVLREAAPTFAALRMSPAAIERRAAARLAEILSTAARTPLHAPRIGRSHRGADPREILTSLPPLTKDDLRSAGTDALAGGEYRAEWRSSLSTGSTGEPFRTWFDPRAWAILKILVKGRGRVACGLRPHHRVAVLDAVPAGDPEPSRGPASFFRRVRVMSILRPPKEVASDLERFRPDVVYGLPSALLDAAGALQQPMRVTRVFTSGELLSGDVRRRLEDAYGAPVRDVYGSTETKEIAFECPRGALHVNADVARVEVLDESGAAVAPGEEGDLAVTVLVNHAMPLLRYMIGDRGMLPPEPCGCGLPFPRMGVVTGRDAETLDLAGERVSPYAITVALEAIAGLRRYQVRQIGPAAFRVHAVLDRGTSTERAGPSIIQALGRALPGEPAIELLWHERLPRRPGEKFRVVVPFDPALPAEPAPETEPR